MCVYTKNKAKRKETGAQKDCTLYMKIPFQMSVNVHECKSVCTFVCVCVPRCAYVLIGSSHRAADGSIKEPLNGLALVNS